MDTPEFVARPAHNMGRPMTKIVAALIETATNGQACRIPLNGSPALAKSHLLRNLLYYRGYFLRSRKDGDALICWVEKREDGA